VSLLLITLWRWTAWNVILTFFYVCIPLHYIDHDFAEKFANDSLSETDLENRRNLCIAAKENFESTEVIFFDNYVPEPYAFELEYSDRKETTLAIPCPTLPLLLVHNHRDGLLMSSLIQTSSINQYYIRNLDRKFYSLIRVKHNMWRN